MMKFSPRANSALRRVAVPFLALGLLSGTAMAQTASFSLRLEQGWNLLGNSINQALDVASATLFGDTTKVTTVWKWDPASSNWQFYAPSMTAADLQTYATGKGYGVLSQINPGEGYWVNAKVGATLGTQTGAGATPTLIPGWNLVGSGSNVSPTAFNAGQTAVNITTLWAWDTASSKWYFHAPSMEAQGGTVLEDYITSKDYLSFSKLGKLLGNGTGFWVNGATRTSTSVTTTTTTTASTSPVTTTTTTTTSTAATTTTTASTPTTTGGGGGGMTAQQQLGYDTFHNPNYCIQCHAPPDRAGRTFAMIQEATLSVPAMGFLSALDESMIQAVAAYLAMDRATTDN